MWYICRGKGRMRIDGQTKEISGGDCLLLRPGVDFHGTGDPKRPLVVIAVHFDFINADRRPVMPDIDALPLMLHSLREPFFFESVLRRVDASFNAGRKEVADRYFSAAIQEFFHHATRSPAPPQQVDMINDICNDISRNPGRRYGVDELAGHAGYSSDHFSRIFKSIKGISPGEFIIQSRIQAGKAFLTNSNHSIAHIAEILGYSDQFFFTRQFRNRTGQSPSQFKNK